MQDPSLETSPCYRWNTMVFLDRSRADPMRDLLDSSCCSVDISCRRPTVIAQPSGG